MQDGDPINTFIKYDSATITTSCLYLTVTQILPWDVCLFISCSFPTRDVQNFHHHHHHQPHTLLFLTAPLYAQLLMIFIVMFKKLKQSFFTSTFSSLSDSRMHSCRAEQMLHLSLCKMMLAINYFLNFLKLNGSCHCHDKKTAFTEITKGAEN